MILYDLRYQPLSIGDFINYMEIGELLADADLAYYYNPEKPTAGDPGLSHISRDNFHEFFEPFRCLTDKILVDEPDEYWPPPHLRGRYLFYHIYNEMFLDGVKPLKFKSVGWAADFLKEHDAKYCVQLRKNPFPNNCGRNSDYDVWYDFLRNRGERFVLIGETEPRFRMDNTVIAKDYSTTVEQDLAIAAACDVYMGPPSGPSGAVIFNDKPYRLFNMVLNPARCMTYKVDGRRGKFAWAKDEQGCTLGAPSAEFIADEFERMTACYH